MPNLTTFRASVPEHSLGVAWLDCLRHVLTHGVTIDDGPDLLREVRNYSVTLTSVRTDDPVLLQFADQDRIALMLRKYRSLETLPEYKISYGALLYDHQGVDQVQWVIRRLQQKHETKSATIALHTPGDSELSCLSLLDFKLRGGALHMTAVYRSQNVYASQPGNLLALREVQQDVASALDVGSGELALLAASAHIYEPDVAAALEILSAYERQTTTGP